jgi:hypothetical protein
LPKANTPAPLSDGPTNLEAGRSWPRGQNDGDLPETHSNFTAEDGMPDHFHN